MERTSSDRDNEKESSSDRQRDAEQESNSSKAETGSAASLHKTVGNQAVQQMYENGELQAKFTVSQPNDRSEREAERVASSVVQIDSPERKKNAGESTSQTKTENNWKGGIALHRDATAAPVSGVSREAERNIRSLEKGGQPLSESERAYFEPRFGRDFSNVRIHTGRKADDAAKSINAEAFTLGRNIAFREGNYSPNTRQGRKLLAHELTHVVQQDEADPKASSEVGMAPNDRNATQKSREVNKQPRGAGPWPNVRTSTDSAHVQRAAISGTLAGIGAWLSNNAAAISATATAVGTGIAGAMTLSAALTPSKTDVKDRVIRGDPGKGGSGGRKTAIITDEMQDNLDTWLQYKLFDEAAKQLLESRPELGKPAQGKSSSGTGGGGTGGGTSTTATGKGTTSAGAGGSAMGQQTGQTMKTMMQNIIKAKIRNEVNDLVEQAVSKNEKTGQQSKDYIWTENGLHKVELEGTSVSIKFTEGVTFGGSLMIPELKHAKQLPGWEQVKNNFQRAGESFYIGGIKRVKMRKGSVWSVGWTDDVAIGASTILKKDRPYSAEIKVTTKWFWQDKQTSEWDFHMRGGESGLSVAPGAERHPPSELGPFT